MKNQVETSDLLGTLVSHAASVELRFSSRNGLARSLQFYLDFSQDIENPESTVPPVSMRMGQMQELRLTEAATNTDCTVMYWQVADNSEAGLLAAYKALQGKGCHVLEAPYYRPDQPKTACCLVQDPGGNRVGLIINPPFPFIVKAG